MPNPFTETQIQTSPPATPTDKKPFDNHAQLSMPTIIETPFEPDRPQPWQPPNVPPPVPNPELSLPFEPNRPYPWQPPSVPPPVPNPELSRSNSEPHGPGMPIPDPHPGKPDPDAGPLRSLF
ncbi:hypothetical protein DOTSEDRAFT_25523 [Dothistroma septosporum NZE10]|uniref:Uncharacterized protein n=1 Tax=Dothistroma septosporum (strain NZE10 / CBS 128990) TaxID=675120 RepID=M2YNK6_DOTSN|nr:hypothetical protein DOTSEDRAFT_25523 [Dothistroma septosporum NZE10]